MRFPFVLAFLAVMLLPHFAQAKRLPPPTVEPVVYESIQYTAPNDDGSRPYIRATDVKTGKVIREIEVFHVHVNPRMEQDVQHIFIKNMKLKGGALLVIDERDHVYSVDLKSGTVKALAPPTK